MKEKFNLIATAAAGLEAVVGREIRELGLDCQIENGRVHFEGDVSTIIQTNLWLRAADRIKIIVGSFPTKTFEERVHLLINSASPAAGIRPPRPKAFSTAKQAF